MWSIIADKKQEAYVSTEHKKIEENITTVEVPTRFDLEFKRNIKKFIRENYEMLNYIYNKCFKDYSHIDKKDFYIFAYYNSIK
jgi:hypothetical protein